jgi:peroxiredoxin
VKVGSKAPPFTISMSDGSEGVVLRKALAKGKPVVVAFWAYHCVPCTHELPMLQKLSDELGDKVSFLLIHDGPDETLMKAKLAELKVTLPSASDDTRAKEERYCVHELPRTFVIDHDGVVRAIFETADEPRLRDQLFQLGVTAAHKG